MIPPWPEPPGAAPGRVIAAAGVPSAPVSTSTSSPASASASAWQSFWRAAATCWQPQVLLQSLLAMLLAALAVGVLGWVGWEPALDAVRDTLSAWALGGNVLQWLHSVGAPHLRSMIAPMVVVALGVPLLLMLVLLLASALAPAVARQVAARHQPALEARFGAGRWPMLAWALACTAATLLLLLLSMPLWLLPPLVLVLPPLICGWLASRVLAFNVLARHASAAERRAVMRQRRWTLLAMGVTCGYLAALPALIFAAGSAALMLAPLLAIVAVALSTAIFMFAACWFAHVCLGELQWLRQSRPIEPIPNA
ncbi:MAG: EI24 domain-containing protein [Rubrivivax sp.]|nr:EI24 domain-containing protein [Rubrivivax sp.]